MLDFIIVGGGLIGMLTARELADAGAKVALYEKGETGRESSWAGGGILSPLYPWRYPDAVTQLARWSQAHYPALAERLLAETGIDPQWQQSGLLMLDIDDAEQAQALAWAGRHGYEMVSLKEEAVRELQPGVGAFSGNSLWMPAIGQLRNPRLLQSLRQHLLDLGVILHEHSPVSAIISEQGRVRAIESGGQRIAADNVIVASGAWSAEILRGVGPGLDVEPVRGQMLLFRAEPGLLSHMLLSRDHYVIPRCDGRILAGSTLEHSGFDKSTTEQGRQELLAHAARIFPPLQRYEVEKHWAGLRPGSSLGIPFIGACPGHAGLYVNAGHYRNGVVMGLASARLMADLALARPPILDPEPFALSRTD